MTQRWLLNDPAAPLSVYVPINPNKMEAPARPRNMQWAWGTAWGQDRMRGIDQPGPATQWTFSGLLLTKAHYDLLLDWSGKLTRLNITDHLERTFEVVIQKFDPVERLPTRQRAWRADYTMTCLLLKEITA